MLHVNYMHFTCETHLFTPTLPPLPQLWALFLLHDRYGDLWLLLLLHRCWR